MTSTGMLALFLSSRIGKESVNEEIGEKLETLMRRLGIGKGGVPITREDLTPDSLDKAIGMVSKMDVGNGPSGSMEGEIEALTQAISKYKEEAKAHIDTIKQKNEALKAIQGERKELGAKLQTLEKDLERQRNASKGRIGELEKALTSAQSHVLRLKEEKESEIKESQGKQDVDMKELMGKVAYLNATIGVNETAEDPISAIDAAIETLNSSLESIGSQNTVVEQLSTYQTNVDRITSERDQFQIIVDGELERLRQDLLNLDKESRQYLNMTKEERERWMDSEESSSLKIDRKSAVDQGTAQFDVWTNSDTRTHVEDLMVAAYTILTDKYELAQELAAKETYIDTILEGMDTGSKELKAELEKTKTAFERAMKNGLGPQAKNELRKLRLLNFTDKKALEKNVKELQENLKKAEGDRKRAEEEMNHIAATNRLLQKRADGAKHAINRMITGNPKGKLSKDELKEFDFSKKISILEALVEDLRKTNSSDEKDSSEAMEMLMATNASLRDRISSLEKDMEKANEELANGEVQLREGAKTNQERIDNLKRQLDDEKSVLAAQLKEAQTLAEDKENLVIQCKDHASQLTDQFTARIGKLEEEREALEKQIADCSDKSGDTRMGVVLENQLVKIREWVRKGKVEYIGDGRKRTLAGPVKLLDNVEGKEARVLVQIAQKFMRQIGDGYGASKSAGSRPDAVLLDAVFDPVVNAIDELSHYLPKSK